MSVVTFNPSARLGNLIFMAMTTISYAIKHNINYKLPDKLSYVCEDWQKMLKYLVTCQLETDTIGGHHVTLREPGNHVYADLPCNSSMEKIVLEGYFQHYRFFDENFLEVRKILGFEHHISDLRQKVIMKDGQEFLDRLEKSTSIHFRFGDYAISRSLRDRSKTCVLPVSYYIQAITKILPIENSHDIFCFCEFSNEVSQYLQQLNDAFPKIKFHLISNEYSPLESILLMSLAKNNIIANSSFSWLSAYLNQNVEKNVVMPKYWLMTHGQSDKFSPDGWIALEND